MSSSIVGECWNTRLTETIRGRRKAVGGPAGSLLGVRRSLPSASTLIANRWGLHQPFTQRVYGPRDEVKETDMDVNDGKPTKLRTTVVVATVLAVLAVMLFRVPLAMVFTIGVLLICPLLMVGMHGAHSGGHGGQGGARGGQGGGHGGHATTAGNVPAYPELRHEGR